MLLSTTKKIAAHAMIYSIPKARYRNMIFVLSHMRAATTALSNVLCSCPEISGYGETHVSYVSKASVGQTVVNLMIRCAWEPKARFIFDKVLHGDLHMASGTDFFEAHAIFLIRSPTPAVQSIVRLARHTGNVCYQCPQAAAQYYLDRLLDLKATWFQFHPRHRFGLFTEDLLSDPETYSRDIGAWLGLQSELGTSYKSHPASLLPGGGDPILSGEVQRIIPHTYPFDLAPIPGVSRELSKACMQQFLDWKAIIDEPERKSFQDG
ncbi:sulfotransferase family protein [Cognatishimia sp.]|uniref:sulfotransferase family protein n=1 Tax=Cognatishimia sp. TaxID=2211648 RepID=UPI003BAA6C77